MTNVIFTPQRDSTSKWSPIVGEFTDMYLRELSIDEEGKKRLINESAQILSNCTDPTTKKYSEAGLVLGFVQSGKTLSFTTITALSRDNGYGIVIVLAGVTDLLRVQSRDRLVDDLGLEKFREWRVFDNPGGSTINFSSSDFADFRDKVEQWKNWQSGGRIKKPSVLITVLKQSGRINNLSNLLGAINLDDVPILIIDDESDQASPNTKSASNLKKGLSEASSTYEAIDNLRSHVPRHTYLQYTATPQANLLAAKSDALSPAFSRVISAGPDYVGGEDFFIGSRNNVVQIPTSDEIQVNALPEEPPKSFQESLYSFWVASAIAMAENHRASDGTPATRSMMIQTSARTQPHALFASWVRSMKALWKDVLRNSESASYQDLMLAFKEAFDQLTRTYSTNLSFDELREWIVEAIDETKVVEVNSKEDAVKEIHWYESQFWILVGGMKLDRGFTVKGITHTYMPRSVAENAATLQQRARFFGYHRKYFGLCRIYIAKSTLYAFIAYVEHEKSLRESLQLFQGRPLKEWKRTFILDQALSRPVRPNVIGIKVAKTTVNESWVAPRFMHENFEAIEKNNKTFETFVTEILDKYGKGTLPEEWVDKREGSSHILVEGVPVSRILDLFVDLEFTNGEDAKVMMALAVSLAREISRTTSTFADVVLINGLSVNNLEGRNSTVKGIDNLFIGRSPKTISSVKQLNYVGDREIHTKQITLHLRKVLVKNVLGAEGEMIPIPWVALKPTEELGIQILEEIE